MRVHTGVAPLMFQFGRISSGETVTVLDAWASYAVMGHILERFGFADALQLDSSAALFDAALREIGSRPVLYLEFGVYKGDSLRFWLEHSPHPGSRFFGFDSFVGLPEHWHEDAPRGHYSADGRLPDLNDSRASIVPGWFEETLPSFDVPEHELMFVNIDCDLYSSTTTVLQKIAPHLRVGDYLYFDELNSRSHELRAFREFLDTGCVRLRAVATAKRRSKWLFSVTEVQPTS